jgi:hypothetical protein
MGLTFWKFTNFFHNKIKWIYIIGISIFMFFYLPLNHKFTPNIIKTGFIDKEGKIVIKPKFINSYDFKSGLCVAVCMKYPFCDLSGYINRKGEFVVPADYDHCRTLTEGIGCVSKYYYNSNEDNDFKWESRLINKDGIPINNKIYKKAGPFYEGLASVSTNGNKYGYINTHGETIISEQYLCAHKFSEGLAAVKIQVNSKGELTRTSEQKKLAEESMFKNETEEIYDKFTYIDKKGNFVFKDKNGNPKTFIDAGNFSEGLAWVKVELGSKEKYGFIDKSGEFVIKPQFSNVQDFKEGIAAVRVLEEDNIFISKKWGFVTPSGKIAIKPEYDEVENFSENLARVRLNYKYGFIDKSGRKIIPCVYRGARDFHEGLAAVTKNNKWGFIDKTGIFVIEPQFYKARNFSEGLAAVSVKVE